MPNNNRKMPMVAIGAPVLEIALMGNADARGGGCAVSAFASLSIDLSMNAMIGWRVPRRSKIADRGGEMRTA
jgi:hypothetical protein